MSRRFVDQIGDGENVEEVYLVADKQLRTNKNGNPYIQVELRDRTGGLTGRFWNAGEAIYRTFESGDFIFIKAKAQLFQGTLQIILTHLERVDTQKVELNDFLPHTPQDVGKLLERLRAIVLKVGNHHLRALAEVYLMDSDFVHALSTAPAGVRVHHAYIGGLLEHVVTMLELGERIVPLYPDIDRDLLAIGIFLHDSGKVRELSYDRTFGYTDEGQLIGHLDIGVEMLTTKIPQVADLTGEPFPRELLLRLKHMILSHHGALEHGSPRVPMTPEAVALHAIDMLDSRVHICLREIKDDRGSGSWTAYNQAMQRRLYKGGSGSVEAGTSQDGY